MIINNGSFEVDVQAIGYSIDSNGRTVLHKYGSVEMITFWMRNTMKVYLENGFSDMAAEIRMLEVEGILEEEVDKMINCSGYIGRFLKKEKGKIC